MSNILSLVNVGTPKDPVSDGGPPIKMMGNSYVSGVKVGFTTLNQTPVMNGISAVYHSYLCSLKDPNHEEYPIANAEDGGAEEVLKLPVAEVITDVRGYENGRFYTALEFKMFDFFNRTARTVIFGDPTRARQTDWMVGNEVKISGNDIAGVQVMTTINVALKKIEGFPHKMMTNLTAGFSPNSIFDLFKGADYTDNAKASCRSRGLLQAPIPSSVTEKIPMPNTNVQESKKSESFTTRQMVIVLILILFIISNLMKEPDVPYVDRREVESSPPSPIERSVEIIA